VTYKRQRLNALDPSINRELNAKSGTGLLVIRREIRAIRTLLERLAVEDDDPRSKLILAVPPLPLLCRNRPSERRVERAMGGRFRKSAEGQTAKIGTVVERFWADAMHTLLVKRADALMGCTEASPEEEELRALAEWCSASCLALWREPQS
jgi:hypothetical protein